MNHPAAVSPRVHPRLPPGPKGRILLGSAVELGRNWLGFLARCAREYGDVSYFRFFNHPMCLLTHPDAIEYVLAKNPSNFVKTRDFRALGSLLGRGLLTSEGAFWQRNRRMIQPAFRHENILAYSRIMMDSAQRMLGSWRDAETRDVHRDMMALTLEIVGQALFGSTLVANAAGIGAALATVMAEFSTQASLAYLLPDWLPLPRTPRLYRAVRQLDAVVYRIIRERRARPGQSPASPPDLLGRLLAAGSESTPEKMTDRQIRDEVMTLLIAGHETTALALSWTFYLLAGAPEVESHLLEELRSVLPGDRPPAAADLPRLRYTEMVVKESMRLYPPAWGIGREAIAPFEIDGYRLPKRTNVLLLQWITQRDARFFPDPERFNPERWRDDPVRSGRVPRFAYFPFGGGPRVCVGAGFAMMEAVLLLAAIARRFHLSLAPGHTVALQPSITLRPKHGMWMRLACRSQETIQAVAKDSN